MAVTEVREYALQLDCESQGCRTKHLYPPIPTEPYIHEGKPVPETPVISDHLCRWVTRVARYDEWELVE